MSERVRMFGKALGSTHSTVLYTTTQQCYKCYIMFLICVKLIYFYFVIQRMIFL